MFSIFAGIFAGFFQSLLVEVIALFVVWIFFVYLGFIF